MAVSAGLYLLVFYIFLTALGGFLKIDSQIGLGIRALARCIGIGPAGAAAKSAAEKAVEDIRKVEARALEGVASSGAAAKVGIHSGVPELIVPGPLVAVRKHLIGLVDFLKLSLGTFVTGVQIGVVLLRQFPIGLFDIVVRGRLLYAKYLVVVSFVSHSNQLLKTSVSSHP